LGALDASVASMTRTVLRLAEKYDRLQFSYEGLRLRRLISALGHDCMVLRRR
jgi:hypothetical protein